MARTIEINILGHDAESWLGDTTGVDVEKTVERYADLVYSTLKAVYPGRDIEVNVLPRRELQTRRAIVVDGNTDGAEVESVGWVLTDVFNGKHGEYIVLEKEEG